MDYKSILFSKTLWGVVSMAIPVVSKALGHEIATGDVTGVVNQAQQMLNDAFTFGGMVLAIWGRMTATKPLKLI